MNSLHFSKKVAFTFLGLFMFVYLGILVPGKDVPFEHQKLNELAAENKDLQVQLKIALNSLNHSIGSGDLGNKSTITEKPPGNIASIQEKKLIDAEIQYREKMILLKKDAANIAKRKSESRNFSLPVINTQLSKKQIILLFTPASLAFLLYVLLIRLKGMLKINSGHGTLNEDYWFVYPLPFSQLDRGYLSIAKNLLGILIPLFVIYVSIDTYYWSEFQNARGPISDSIILPLILGCAVFFFAHIITAIYIDFKSIDKEKQ